ncbi:MAG: flagellar hook-length control protein FliK [Dissulfurispiraceae bacterium]
MLDSLMVQASAKTLSLGITSSSVPEGIGEDGSPATNFTDLLQAIVSGDDKSLGNLQGGSIIRADGKTAASENLMELIQRMSKGKGIGSDKKSASGDSVTDVLQQMMAQLQTSFAQPVTFIAPYQSGNASSSDTTSITATGMDSGNDGAGALIAALGNAIQKGDIKRQIVSDTPEVPLATGQTAGKQLDMDSVLLTQDTVVTDQNAPIDALDNAGTSGANLEVAAFSVAAQKSLTGNTERLVLNTPNASTLNPANDRALNTASLTTANTTTLNFENTATLNNANTSTLNNANIATLNNSNSATLNNSNSATLTTANDTMVNSGRGTFNSLMDGTTGNLGIKEISLSLNNQNKSTSGDADSNAAFSPAALQQTPLANDSQPAQETLPVNKLNELSDPIVKTLASGGKSLVIKLSPPEMGTIEIRLKVENGVLTADFKVDSSAVKDLFSVAMPQIKNSIESAGVKTGNFFADLKDDRSTGGGRQQDANQQQQRQQKEQKQSFFDFFA